MSETKVVQPVDKEYVIARVIALEDLVLSLMGQVQDLMSPEGRENLDYLIDAWGNRRDAMEDMK